MHWIINCAFLASVAVLAAAEDTDPKPKRDLSLITDLISGKIFQDPPAIPQEKVKVYKVEGLDGVVVKAVLKDKVVEKEELPQANMKEALLNEDPRIALVSSYLGTKTLNETLVALKNIKTLLESGVLHSQEEIRKVVPPILFESTARVPEINEFSVVPLLHAIPTVSLPVNANPTVCSCKPRNPNSSTKNIKPTENKPSLNLPPGSITTPESVLSQVDVVVDQQKVSLNPNKFNDDGVVTSYEQAETNKRGGIRIVVQEVDKPFGISPFFGSRIEDAAYRAYLTASDVIRNNPQYSSAYPFISQHGGRVYEPSNNGAQVTVSHNNAADYWKVPSHYSYTSVHKDGSQTSYTSSGLFNQKVEYSPGSSSVVSKSHVNNVVFKDEKPQLLPGYIADRIQNATATAHQIEFPTLNPTANFAFSQQTQINEQPKEQDKVTVGGLAASIAGSSYIPSGYSYTVIHKDGTSTTYSDSGSNRQNVANYSKKNKFDTSTHEQNIVNVAGVTKPTPISSVVANRVEKVQSAVEITTFRPVEVQQEYVTPIPIYGTVHPVHSPINDVNVAVDGQIPNNVPPKYSYTTVHKDGSRTTYTGSGLGNENSQTNVLKEVNNIYGHYHGSGYYDENRFEQTNIKKPRTATVVPIFIDKKPDNDQTVGTRRVLFPKPIVSKYSYKQTNSNFPNQFVVVKVGNSPNYDGFIKLNNHNVAYNAEHNVQHNNFEHHVQHDVQHNIQQNVEHNIDHNINVKPDYVFIPPIFEDSQFKKQVENKFTQTESGFTYASKNDNSNFKIVNTKDEEHHEVTSDNSLNANPIVVLPDEPTFSYTQKKKDGSSVHVVADNNNNVSVNNKIATTESVIHRGDIPDTVV